MAVAHVEVMSKFNFIKNLFIAAAIVTIIIIPAYQIDDPISITEIQGCSVNQILKNQCYEEIWHQRTGESIYSNMPLDDFVFQLPRLHSIDLYHDYTKWRSQLKGCLSINMEQRTFFTAFQVYLMAQQQQANSKWSVYDNSTLKIGHDDSSDPLNYTSDKSASITSLIYTEMSLFNFEPSPFDLYVVIVRNPLKTHGTKVNDMTLRLTMMRHSGFIEYMRYHKLLFFVFILILTACFEFKLFKYSVGISLRNIAILLLSVSMGMMTLPLEWIPSQPNIILPWKVLQADLNYLSLAFVSTIIFYEWIVKHRKDVRWYGARLSLVLVGGGFILRTIFHSYQIYMEIFHPMFNKENAQFRMILTLTSIAGIASMGLVHLLNLFLSLNFSKAMPEATIGANQRYDHSAFIMIISVICTLITIIDSMYYDMVQYQIQWCNCRSLVQYPVQVSIAVFAMWNVYTLLMLYLYMPVRENDSTSSSRESKILLPPRDEIIRNQKHMESVEIDTELEKTGFNDEKDI